MADTDALIQQALKEEEAERKRAKQEKAAQGACKLGTLVDHHASWFGRGGLVAALHLALYVQLPFSLHA